MLERLFVYWTKSVFSFIECPAFSLKNLKTNLHFRHKMIQRDFEQNNHLVATYLRYSFLESEGKASSGPQGNQEISGTYRKLWSSPWLKGQESNSKPSSSCCISAIIFSSILHKIINSPLHWTFLTAK